MIVRACVLCERRRGPVSGAAAVERADAGLSYVVRSVEVALLFVRVCSAHARASVSARVCSLEEAPFLSRAPASFFEN